VHQQDHPKEYVRLHQEREALSLQHELQVAKGDLKDDLDTQVAVAEFEASKKLTKYRKSTLVPKFLLQQLMGTSNS